MGRESTVLTSSSKRLGFSWNTKQLRVLQMLCYERPPRSPNSEGWWFQSDVRTLHCSPPFSNLTDKVTAFPVSWKGSSASSRDESFTCEVSSFRRGADDVFALLGCYAAYVGIVPTFRDSCLSHVQGSSSRLPVDFCWDLTDPASSQWINVEPVNFIKHYQVLVLWISPSVYRVTLLVSLFLPVFVTIIYFIFLFHRFSLT